MLSATLLTIGLILLLAGAKFLVDGVSAIARAAGVSPLVVGLTVVAFGTSTPEVVINGIAAYRGETALAFGNIIGSCAINVGFVLAVTAIICPLAVQPSIITREIPLLLLTVAALVVMSEDMRLTHAAADSLSRADGLILLLIFCVFVYSIITQALDKRSADAFVADVVEEERSVKDRATWVDFAMTLGGLIGVAGGGRMTVVGATGIAEAAGIPEHIIGLTIISFGTTLPELATSIIAARKGQSDLAIGNVIGSNIYNLLFIGGMVSTISPIPIPRGGELDLLVMAGLCVALLPIAMRQRKVTRGEGLVLLMTYLSYVIFRVTRGTAA